MRIASPGHALFAATLIALGAWGLAIHDFTALWQPVPKSWPAREALAYLCAAVAFGCGLGLLWRRTAAGAAGVLTLYLLAWTLASKGPGLARHLGDAGVWDGFGEGVMLAVAAWTLFAAFAKDWSGRAFAILAGETGLRIARTLYGLALVDFGIAHFGYLGFTASLVPAWLPWHEAWAELTGVAYIAAGLAILTGVLPRLAATLAAAQMAGFTLLVWAPRLAAGPLSAGQMTETVMSWTLTAAAWALADSYRGAPWFAARLRPATA